MIQQLELKHLAAYLPYKLNILREGKIVELCGLEQPYKTNKSYHIRGETKIPNGTYRQTCSFYVDEKGLEVFKPILRPLSDLTKEIEHNGERFIPMVELLKISQTDQIYNLTAKYDVVKAWSDTGSIGLEYFSIRYSWEASNDMVVIADLMYDTMFNRFTLRQKQPLEKCQWLQYDVLEEKLLEWHFDKFKLLQYGLAISINDIK
jgi:hypothetical protein